jgi:predicted O-methyltransferase YrrM
MFFFRILKYLEYLLISKHRKGHGINSPFVFDLVSRTFRNKIDPGIVLLVENTRTKNRSDKRVINVSDLGAGSERMKNSLRKVSDTARYSAIPARYGRLLFNMASEFGKPVMIELGTSLGISTMYLALADPGNTVYTIEGCPQTAKIAKENFKNAGIKNISLMNGSFDEMIHQLEKENIRPGLVFIDGDHRKEQLLKYFYRMAYLSDDRTVVIIDDIHHSPEMEEAWHEIRQNENVSVTIDIFRMGFVFFRKGINRLSYVIRY